MKNSESIKTVQLIVHPGNAGWILEKIAIRLKEKFKIDGLDVQILESPRGDSDIVFWLYFGHRGIVKNGGGSYTTRLKSAFVTHVDDATKLNIIRRLNEDGVDLVFMSPSHSHEISSMLGFTEPFFNILLGTDLVETEQKMKIGLFSKCFDDGRKNEAWLVELAKKENLKDCEFIFIGTGWNRIRDELEAAGAEVKLYDGIQYPYPDYSEFPTFYRSLDLYLNLGFDEGSMGSLDAYVLGVKLLVSRQGFHNEFDRDADSFFSNYQEFSDKFIKNLEHHRSYQKAIKMWSWTNTADFLLNHWKQKLVFSNHSTSIHITNADVQHSAKWSRKHRRTYFTFMGRAVDRFINIRLRDGITRKLKSRFHL